MAEIEYENCACGGRRPKGSTPLPELGKRQDGFQLCSGCLCAECIHRQTCLFPKDNSPDASGAQAGSTTKADRSSGVNAGSTPAGRAILSTTRTLSDERIHEIAYFGSTHDRGSRYWNHEGVEKAIRQALAEAGVLSASGTIKQGRYSCIVSGPGSGGDTGGDNSPPDTTDAAK